MARSAEKGIEYFPMNTDIFQNKKVKLLVAEFGCKTWGVLLPLYCKIYKENGYWMDWMDEDAKLLFAQDDCKIELNFVNEVVAGCIRRSLFNKEVFNMFGVLTSDRIQYNYFTATARRKTKVIFIEQFLVTGNNVDINRENVYTIGLSADIIKKNVSIGTQSKKENKKEIIEGECAEAPTHTQDQILLFSNFSNFILTKAINVAKMKEPFKIDEYLKLREDFDPDYIKNLLMKMHNYKPLLQKNISAYLTFLNWSKRSDSLESVSSDIKTDINDQLKAALKAR